eukprot:TRINITY_DN3953_c0_g1_i2.p1 TRINITY_DN3953_c0_g1~~TRINITY_DN3953_c0_g1_i2.p1  ORF type:complete len:642 (+),score=137.09 TRINITY_DN3953_c0_g1_i2:61-1986(+)
MVKPSSEDLEYLDTHTRLTKREIEKYYSSSQKNDLDRRDFDSLLDKSGLFKGNRAEMIRGRFYTALDVDSNGTVSMREMVVMLSTLERGTVEDLAKLFFDLYDENKNGQLEKHEIVHVYSGLLSATTKTTMTDYQVEKVSKMIAKVDTNHDGQLNFSEFLAMVKKSSHSSQPITCRVVMETIFLVIMTSLFEMGTSFALPAMGALSARIRDRYDIGNDKIGTAQGLYYVGSIFGPMLFGLLMDKLDSPIATVTYANIAVVIGAGLQAFAPTFWVLCVARVVLGFGGDSTPFGTVETLQRLFPNQFLLMAGVRNLVQSASGAFAFLVLPELADRIGSGVEGTIFALWFCFALAVLSLVANIIVWIYMAMTHRTCPKRTTLSIASGVRQYTKAITPQPLQKPWLISTLPLSLIPAVLGIQAFYYPTFAFTAFSVDLFITRFGTGQFEASVLSGAMSLIGGLCGPFFGPLSDYFGGRALSMALWMIPSVVAFLLFGFFSSLTPWVGIVLLGMTYGWGDTVSYASIRLLVGPDRAGLGYGIFGMVGSFLGFLVPEIGGKIYAAPDGGVNINWYFAALCGFGGLCWLVVRLLEGPKSAMELPASKLIETEDADINVASMYAILGSGKEGEEVKEPLVDPGSHPIAV